MKNLLKLSFLSLIVLFSCSEESILENINQNETLESKLLVTKTTSTLTETTFNLGVREITPIKNSEESFSFKLNGSSTNINGYYFNPNSNELNIDRTDNSDIVISFKNSNNSLKISSNNIEFSISDINYDYTDENLDLIDKQKETELIELITLYNELTNPNLNRNPYASNTQFYSNKSETCTWHAMSIRNSRGYAEVRAVRAAEEWIADGHSDCQMVGDVNSGCAWEDFGCIAEQTIECNGSSCD
jgi:hypothetical protein